MTRGRAARRPSYWPGRSRNRSRLSPKPLPVAARIAAASRATSSGLCRVAPSTPKAAGRADRGHQLGRRGAPHPAQNDRMLDAQQLADPRTQHGPFSFSWLAGRGLRLAGGAGSATPGGSSVRQPPRQRRVHGARLLLRHPVAGGHDDLGEVPAVAPHGLGEPGVDGLAGVVVLAVQEQHGHARACRRSSPAPRSARLRSRFMYQESGPKKPLRVERRRVRVAVLFGDHVGVHRHVGRLARSAEPAAVACGPARCATACPCRSGSPFRNRALTMLRGVGVERRRAPCRSSPRRRAGSPTAPPGTAPPDRPRDRRAGSGCAGRSPPRDTARRGWPRRSSAPGWWLARLQTTGLPQSWPTQTAFSRPSASSSSSMSRDAVLERVVLVARVDARSGHSRACPARSRGSRGRRSTAADAAS